MRLGDYSLAIENKNHTPEGYVQMAHLERYSVRLQNHGHRRADVTLKIDNEEVGTWRLDRMSRIVLERGAHDAGMFTFLVAGTAQATAAGLVAIPAENLGRITAIFKPERPVRSVPRGMGFKSYDDRFKLKSMGSGLESMSYNSVAGGTGLTGQSSQQFTTVERLVYDDSATVEINLRLIGYATVQEVRPKVTTPLSNPVPPPVC